MPLVSVCLITYNHVEYIRQAITSIINQKIDFSWEFIIADDFSSDGTRDIISEFRIKYPIIKLIFQNQNVGARRNWYDLLDMASGKYIAYCEGDDYWLDTDKLQSQINFLEKNPNFCGCFHNSEERYEETDKASFLYCHYPVAQKVTFKDLSYSNVIPSCSMVYRNKLFSDFPNWFHELKMGDWPLHLLNAQYGDYWYIPKVMAVHRLQSKSTWMLQDSDRNNRYVIEAYDIMIKGFNYDNNLVQQLQDGRESFIKSRTAKTENLTVRKIKNYLIGIINKI